MVRRSEGGVVRLPVRVRRQLRRDGSSEAESIVFCPLLARSLPVELCGHCTRAEKAEADSFSCRMELPRDDGRPRVDVAEAAARTYVGEVLTRETVSVREEASVDLALALLDDGVPCVPVVSDGGRLVGVIRPRGIVRDWREGTRHLTAGEVAEVTEETLVESLPLSMAMAVLAVTRDTALPVLSEAGAVVGALSAGDVVRWVAGRMGYAVE